MLPAQLLLITCLPLCWWDWFLGVGGTDLALSAFALSPKESQSKGSSEMSHMSGFILKNAVILFRITAVLALLDP